MLRIAGHGDAARGDAGPQPEQAGEWTVSQPPRQQICVERCFVFAEGAHARTNILRWIVVAMILGTTAFAAIVIPALRASSMDPMVALREK